MPVKRISRRHTLSFLVDVEKKISLDREEEEECLVKILQHSQVRD